MITPLPWIVAILAAAGACMAQMQPETIKPPKMAPLNGRAAEIFQKARGGKWFATAVQLNLVITPTTDEQSFLVVWKATDQPKNWVVSLHGSDGFATDDLAIWYPHLKNRDLGLICLQWWLGTGDKTTSYYTPEQIYRELTNALPKLGVKPGTAMLHGFSRGSANSYSIMALDAGRGHRFFSLAVASSGGVNLNYPPNRSILDGTYGPSPLKNTRWITCAGGHDTHPDRDGIPGMRRTSVWLKKQGAFVLATIEDLDEGHGALVRNSKNAQRVLDLFCKGTN